MIARDLKYLLRNSGAAAFEIGWRQAGEVADIFEAAGFSGANILKDGGGRDRVVTIEAP